MSRLVLTTSLFEKLRAELLRSELEASAVLLGRTITRNGQVARIVVRDIVSPADADYAERTPIAAQLRPEFVARLAQHAKRTGDSLIFAHSHPFGLNSFSRIDDAGEQLLADFLSRRTPRVIHAALLVTPDVAVARILGRQEPLAVAAIGSQLQWGFAPNSSGASVDFDRQIRVFGSEGQNRLSALKIGIVGLGGTGSIVAEQLAHLGIAQFLLIDPDTIEPTNLNRLVGATHRQVGQQKVDAAAEYISRINPNSMVERCSGSVLLAKVAEQLADVDFCFFCTDSQGSRAILNQLAYQYLVPSIDMGSVIVSERGAISHIAARTQMLAPGLGCLVCGNLLDPEAVRVDLLTDFERRTDPYLIGAREPAPAVISLNATISSMAVTMFLAAVLGVPSNARLVNYNGMTGSARAGISAQHSNCVVCSARGALARGNEWPLPARQG